jgi:hypothetical protein
MSFDNFLLTGRMGISMNRIHYRPLPKYKYQLVDMHQQRIRIHPAAAISTAFIDLSPEGVLTIKQEYSWDGPSGPTIDTPNFMRGSLVHDALYQLIRLELLDYRLHRSMADNELRDICIEDGMPRLRASVVHSGVRIGGESHARPPEPLPPAAVLGALNIGTCR